MTLAMRTTLAIRGAKPFSCKPGRRPHPTAFVRLWRCSEGLWRPCAAMVLLGCVKLSRRQGKRVMPEADRPEAGGEGERSEPLDLK